MDYFGDLPDNIDQFEKGSLFSDLYNFFGTENNIEP
jgi:hypothetical protein